MKKENIGVNVHYIPIHLQPFYRQFGFKEGQFPESELYYKEAISLPIYPNKSSTSPNYVSKYTQLGIPVHPIRYP